jgi:hypothetical protein
MTDHPITPPPELVLQWREESSTGELHFSPQYLATQAARWGADQELEACVKLLTLLGCSGTAVEIRAARRPKPPTLKEQALAELEILRIDASAHGLGFDAPAIRRALKALPND